MKRIGQVALVFAAVAIGGCGSVQEALWTAAGSTTTIAATSTTTALPVAVENSPRSDEPWDGRGFPTGPNSMPPGRYSWTAPAADLTLSFALPAGWDGEGPNWMHKAREEADVMVEFATSNIDPDDLVLDATSGSGSVESTAVTVAGYDGRYLELSLRDDPVYVEAYGAHGLRTQVWILDIDGTRVFISVGSYPNTVPADLAEAEAIVHSIRSEATDPTTFEDEPTTFEGEVAPSSDAAPPNGSVIAVDADTRRLPLGERTDLPDNAWFDFLAGLCWGDTCYRDAHVVDPSNDQMGFGRWAADLPFHIRDGFVNQGEAPLGDGFEVVVYVTRRVGPPLEGGVYEIDQTYQFSSDYVLKGTAAKCGPGYWDQTEPQACEWFVHDFSAGLPPGRYDIWARWFAPCSAWLDLGLADSCEASDEVMSRFESSVNMPFYGDGFTEGVQLPFDPYLFPEPITRGASTG